MLPRDTAFFDGEKTIKKGRCSTSSERFREQTDLNKAWNTVDVTVDVSELWFS